jgi:hypothetical protein
MFVYFINAQKIFIEVISCGNKTRFKLTLSNAALSVTVHMMHRIHEKRELSNVCKC